MIALYSNYGFQKVLTWKKFSSELPVEFLEDESALLRRFEDIGVGKERYETYGNIDSNEGHEDYWEMYSSSAKGRKVFR